MPMTAKSGKPRLARSWRRFGRASTGASAVEFALLALPFLSLIVVPLDSGMLIATQMSLDTNMDRATRTLFTGTFQASADGTVAKASDRLRALICDASYRLFDCSAMKLESVSGTTFAGTAGREPYDSSTKGWRSGFGDRFDCPNGGDIVVVRAAMPYQPFFRFLIFNDRKMADGSVMLISTYVFRAEPYPNGNCT